MRNKLCKEPGAEKPHAGICGGQASQGACLPDKKSTRKTADEVNEINDPAENGSDLRTENRHSNFDTRKPTLETEKGRNTIIFPMGTPESRRYL